jgi:RNA 3'-terminal phosphate cyclase (ATP)
MDWLTSPLSRGFSSGERFLSGGKQWLAHAGHAGLSVPHRAERESYRMDNGLGMVDLDGSQGEGGGQILRSSLTLSMLTGRPFQIRKIRANREKPGLRPQHLASVQAAAKLCGAEIKGASVGSKQLTFTPGQVVPSDEFFDIGTAGATALVLHTIYLPMALRADSGVRLTLEGGTFNKSAPSFPFLAENWVYHLRSMGLSVGLRMPSAGFYPRGGGCVEAWIEPGKPQAIMKDRRGALVKIRAEADLCRLDRSIAQRMLNRVEERLAKQGLTAELEIVDWIGKGQGTAITLTSDHGDTRASFTGLGEMGRSAERVADDAIDELLAYLAVPDAAIDPHMADQLLLPLAFAEGRSVFTVSEVTEHLRTNAATIQEFVDRSIRIEESAEGRPGRVVVG